MQMKSGIFWSLIVYILSFSICLGGDSLALNRSIVNFGVKNLNRTVNNGNCWVLPRDALVASGGKFPGPRGNYKTTIFGRQIYPNQLIPGDIIFFQYARFSRYGKIYYSTGQFHYAIVERVYGSSISLLHQNFSGRRYVMRAYIDLREMRSGSIVIYRPQTLR